MCGHDKIPTKLVLPLATCHLRLSCFCSASCLVDNVCMSVSVCVCACVWLLHCCTNATMNAPANWLAQWGESSAAKCVARAARQSAVNCACLTAKVFLVVVITVAAFDYMHYLLLFMHSLRLIVPVPQQLRTAWRIRDAHIAHTTCETRRLIYERRAIYFTYLLHILQLSS